MLVPGARRFHRGHISRRFGNPPPLPSHSRVRVRTPPHYVFQLQVTDVLVCVEFYTAGRLGFAAASTSILLVAQLSYSFLFTATWGRDLKWQRATVVFFCVFPVAQLVPLFAWLESFHFKQVDSAIKRLGLKPTSAIPAYTTPQDTGDNPDANSLSATIRKKWRSHAGFLAEVSARRHPHASSLPFVPSSLPWHRDQSRAAKLPRQLTATTTVTLIPTTSGTVRGRPTSPASDACHHLLQLLHDTESYVHPAVRRCGGDQGMGRLVLD